MAGGEWPTSRSAHRPSFGLTCSQRASPSATTGSCQDRFLFRSRGFVSVHFLPRTQSDGGLVPETGTGLWELECPVKARRAVAGIRVGVEQQVGRSEEHTSELQSL